MSLEYELISVSSYHFQRSEDPFFFHSFNSASMKKMVISLSYLKNMKASLIAT